MSFYTLLLALCFAHHGYVRLNRLRIYHHHHHTEGGGEGKADKPPRCTRELEQLRADKSADWPGVANSDVSPREDVGVVSASGISRSRGRSTTSSGGD